MLLKVNRQSISDCSSTWKRIAGDILSEVPHYSQLLSRYIPVTWADFTLNRSKLESAQSKLLKQAFANVYDFS